MNAKIHPSAIVDPSAKLGRGVEIGPLSVLGPAVELGDGTLVGPQCYIEHATLGKENRVVAQASLGTPPQDVSYAGEPTRLLMGDRNVVRECVTINRGSKAGGRTVLGSDCFLMAYSHVAHNCVLGDKVILANAATLGGHAEIGDNAFLSGLVAVHQFGRIGRCVILSGGAMAVQDIPPFCTAQGDRAKLRGLNLVGMRRAGIPRQSISEVKQAYKTLFLSGFGLEEASAKLRGGNPCPEVVELLDFLASSKRGFAHPADENRRAPVSA